ncbi:hypothetical protein [Microbacterium aurum]|uniref:hypothetical protein n=1 Tax=Microbacterium aurum TaxID=36805 RepID=UPI0028E9C11E|nr:hypothetical protein [Microbacterium aurum]
MDAASLGVELSRRDCEPESGSVRPAAGRHEPDLIPAHDVRGIHPRPGPGVDTVTGTLVVGHGARQKLDGTRSYGQEAEAAPHGLDGPVS